MPHPRHRLDALLVFDKRPEPSPAPDVLFADLVVGGFDSVFQLGFDGERFFSNHQGGFHVRCPGTQRSIVAAFNPALTRWRAGGPRSLTCPCCQQTHDLAELAYAPAAAFGRYVVELRNVARAEMSEPVRDRLAKQLGAFKVVYKRMG